MSGEPAAGDSSPQASEIQWNSSTRIAFRFAFCYCALYCLYLWDGLHVHYLFLMAKQQLTRIPTPLTAPLWHRVVPWVGKHILHLATPITIFSNGSADTTYDYVLALCFLTISAFGALVWFFLDRRRSNYQVLHQWLRLAVILSLAARMLSYGIEKVIPLQFGSLDFVRISEPLGEMTPITLLWNFMAASKPYTITVGMVELVAGLLLLVPRFTTLGALLALCSMANVFALNMCYDVPVKLLSFHLGLLAAFLLLPEAPRLLNVLVLNRPTVPAQAVPLSSNTWIRHGALLFRAAVGLLLFASLTFFSYRTYTRQQTVRLSQVPFYGVWSVDEFNETGNAGAPPLFTPMLMKEMNVLPGNDHWERLIFQSPDAVYIQLSDGTLAGFRSNFDSKSGSLTLTADGDDPAWKCSLSVQNPEPLVLRVQGTVNGGAIAATLHREDQTRFLLLTKGFHWINEYPDYR
jgi:hypothetical protein